jgi:TrmH family RNA methyltransferase
VRSITSRQNPIVRAFRELTSEASANGDRLLLDGVHLVREARAAGLDVERLAVSAAHLADNSEIATLADSMANEGAEVIAVSSSVMTAISPVKTPTGIVAIVKRKPVAVADICQLPNPLVVAPVDVQDPGNLGALLRAAEAGGATGAAICGASASPFSWKAVRGSMGSVLRLPVAAGVMPDALLKCAHKFGLRTVASVARNGQAPDAIDWRGGVLLFVGGEGRGLADELVNACDARVSIPMRSPVESLNVAVAAALLVYEARRTRT